MSACNLQESGVENEHIIGANLFSFCGPVWLNTTCVVMGLMHLRQRFPGVGFVNPFFSQLADPQTRVSVARSWGAFEKRAAFKTTCGVLHVSGFHWTAFAYYPSGRPRRVEGDDDFKGRPVCFLYDCNKAFYPESEALVSELLAAQSQHADVEFVRDGVKKLSDGSSCGVFSLLFLEMHLDGKCECLGAVGDCIGYYRVRYLRHALAMLAA